MGIPVIGHPLDSAGDLQRLMINDTIGRTIQLRILCDDQIVELAATPTSSGNSPPVARSAARASIRGVPDSPA